ncbi:MAG: DUF1579 family protein [Planctomycetota bacterium]
MSDASAASASHSPTLPTDNHALLKPFAGTFRATVTLHFGPDNSQTMTGTMVNEFDLDGRFLKQTYTGDPIEGFDSAFAGRGYWGYNTISNQYEGFWIDTASTAMATEAGDVDNSGKIWTMTGNQPDPCGNGELPKRTVITLLDDDNHTMVTYLTMPDGHEMRTMEISYTRA